MGWGEILAGALGGGASTYGQMAFEEQERKRRAEEAALQRALEGQKLELARDEFNARNQQMLEQLAMRRQELESNLRTEQGMQFARGIDVAKEIGPTAELSPEFAAQAESMWPGLVRQTPAVPEYPAPSPGGMAETIERINPTLSPQPSTFGPQRFPDMTNPQERLAMETSRQSIEKAALEQAMAKFDLEHAPEEFELRRNLARAQAFAATAGGQQAAAGARAYDRGARGRSTSNLSLQGKLMYNTALQAFKQALKPTNLEEVGKIDQVDLLNRAIGVLNQLVQSPTWNNVPMSEKLIISDMVKEDGTAPAATQTPGSMFDLFGPGG